MKKILLLVFCCGFLLIGQNALAEACASPNVCKGKTECTTGTSTQTCADSNQVCCAPANTGGSTPSTGGGTSGPTGGGGATAVTGDFKDLSGAGDIDVSTLIGTIIKSALAIVGSLALIYFIYGGFIILISQGDTTKIDKGKKSMAWATIGLIVIFGSYIFVSYIITNLSTDAGGGGGGTSTKTKDTCGAGKYAGYSCQSVSTDLVCQPGLCPGDVTIQCCKAR